MSSEERSQTESHTQARGSLLEYSSLALFRLKKKEDTMEGRTMEELLLSYQNDGSEFGAKQVVYLHTHFTN